MSSTRERYIALPILASTLIAISVAVYTFLNPYFRSPADLYWALFYLLSFIGLGIAWWCKWYRMLFRFSVIVGGLFLLIVVFFSDNGPALLALLWLLVLSASIGYQIFHWLRLPLMSQHTFEAIILWIGSGMAFLAIITLGFAIVLPLGQGLPIPDRLLHLLHPLPVSLFLIICSLIFIPKLWLGIKPQRSQGWARVVTLWETGGSGSITIAFAALLICSVSGILLALAPSIRYDALTYHLTIPQRYIEARGMVPEPELWNSYWAHYGEMLYTLAMLIVGQPLPGLIHLTFGFLTGGLVYSLASRWRGRNTGLLAALLFFSVPLVNYESATVYIDLIQAFFVFGCIYAILVWRNELNDGWLILAGIFAGFALGIKVSVVTILLPLGIIFFAIDLGKFGFSWKTIRVTLLFLIPTILLYIPWPIRDYLWTGNPIFPMYNSIFKSPLWTSTAPIFTASTSTWLNPLQILLMPWDLVVNTHKYYHEAQNGMLAALPLLALPWLAIWSRSIEKKVRKDLIALTILLGISAVLFLATSPNARYMMPLYAIMAILAAINLDALLVAFQRPSYQPFLRPISIVFVVVYLLSTRLALTVRSIDIQERYPVTVSLGFESPENFLSRSLAVYDTYQYLNTLDKDQGNILAIGTNFTYYSDTPIFPITLSQTASRVTGTQETPEAINHALQEEGFGIIVVDWDSVRTQQLFGLPILQDTFLGKYTKLAFARNNVYAYQVNTNSANPNDILTTGSTPLEPENLAINPGFENRETNTFANWQMNGAPIILASTDLAHTGMIAVQVNENDYLYQDISVGSSQLYTLGYWVHSDTPGQEVRLQIAWRDRNQVTLDIASYTVSTGTGWSWVQLSDTCPRGTDSARIYLTTNSGYQVWIDDVAFTPGTIRIEDR